MILFKKSTDLHNWVETQHKKGKIIVFVPTMGALHPGNISLIEDSKKANDFTVCSIFVNPTQFNDKKDFDLYPVTIEKDLAFLLGIETDVVFLPPVEEIYPAGEKKEHFDLGYLENILEGAYRPGHFQGVCMVVSRLLKIVRPDNFFLGQKDYQQCMVIKKLLELMDIQEINLQARAWQGGYLYLKRHVIIVNRNIYSRESYDLMETMTPLVDDAETGHNATDFKVVVVGFNSQLIDDLGKLSQLQVG